VLSASGRTAVAGLVARGLLDGRAALGGGRGHSAGGAPSRAVLTQRGRLLADAVVRDLTA
jgi:oxygen-independent coproporphyrinogen-3 oxidase